MGESLLDGCSDNCGWAAAVVCVLAFGSFGVPIKKAANVDVDPFILQSYKTIVCFFSSFGVILLGEELRWSNWGLASGIFWVPGACCGIYGIRNAGMAVAVGTWSSIIVLTSFIFGIVVFQERVKNIYYTCDAFLVLIIGLIGMAKYAVAPADEADLANNKKTPMSRTLSQHSKGDEGFQISSNHNSNGAIKTKKAKGKFTKAVAQELSSSTNLQPMEIEPLLDDNSEMDNTNMSMSEIDLEEEDVSKQAASKDRIIFFNGRMALTRHQTGVIGAIINGAWGGLNLIPVHYARRDDGMTGAAFLVSFATGSLIVNTVLWLMLIGYHMHHKKGNWEEVKAVLPKWHFEQLWRVGLTAGLLYSVGNFSALLAVTYLGQGVGFSFCQLQLLVSGLWGVFYFKEIKGKDRIMKWFMSAGVAVVGIICLSFQHEGESAHRR